MAEARNNETRPVLALSMGDPAGVGPEIIVKAMANQELRRAARFVIHGANDVLTLAADRLGIAPDWQRVPADNAELIASADADVVVREECTVDDLIDVIEVRFSVSQTWKPKRVGRRSLNVASFDVSRLRRVPRCVPRSA